MSAKVVFALIVAVVLLPGGALQAQTEEPEEPKTFRLQRDSSTAEAELELEGVELSFHRWVPAVKQGTLEVSFGLGFLNLNTTLLRHDQIIYKYTQENTYFGDVELKGETSLPITVLRYRERSAPTATPSSARYPPKSLWQS